MILKQWKPKVLEDVKTIKLMGQRQKRAVTPIIIGEPLNQCNPSHPFILKNPHEIFKGSL